LVRNLNKAAYLITRSRQRGFTLIEMLIALMIVGLAASVVILNAPPAGQTAKKEATRFAARLSAASSEAIITGEVLGLELFTDGYRFLRYRGGDWVEADGRVLSPWLLEAGLSLSFGVGETVSLKDNDKIISGRGADRGFGGVDFDAEKENAPTPPPPVQFHPYGEDTPVQVAFSDKRARWLGTLSANGDVEVSRDART